MNSKERVRSAIEHKQPDRLPLDFGARSEVCELLKNRWQVKTDVAMLKLLGVDLYGVGPAFKLRQESMCYADPSIDVTPEGIYHDIWGVGFRVSQTDHGQYVNLATHPLNGSLSAGELENYKWPLADWWDYSTIFAQAKQYEGCWIWAHSRGIFEISWFLRGLDNFLIDLACEPDKACAVMNKVQDYLMQRTRRVLEAGNGSIDMVEYNDDVGGQNGMIINPEMWRQFLKPRMAEFIRMCKEFGVKIRYHSCGGIRQIIPDLIEIGVDVLNPIQTLAVGMEPASLKREFGDYITFNGGVDTQELLPYGSKAYVRDKIQELIETMNVDGGYILAPSHVFQPDVPLENILAAYEIVLKRQL